MSANLEIVPVSPRSVDELSFDELSDVELLQLSREGSVEAYAALYVRHDYVARRLARHLGQREDSEDVVAESFAQIFDLLRRGKGPDRAFRAYLFTTIRHESGRRAKARQRVTTTGDDSQLDVAVPFGAGALDSFERSAIRAAYESLPDRWRTVLWHLDVEGTKPSQLAETLGLKPNSVSALVYRARSALREAYLQQHVAIVDGPQSGTCGAVRPHLAGVVRRTATVREQERVHVHLGECADCEAAFHELQEVNREVGAIVTPLALAACLAGTGALASVTFGGALIAQLLATVKGVMLASAIPVAAVSVAAVAVVTTNALSPAVAKDYSGSANEPASVVTVELPSRPAARPDSRLDSTPVRPRAEQVASKPVLGADAAPEPAITHRPDALTVRPDVSQPRPVVLLPKTTHVVDELAKRVVGGEAVTAVKDVLEGVNTLLSPSPH